ncbi:hypothetical protein SAMN05216354_2366 [Xylanibacter ruminicola]|uniref:Uncharacterized protein n=1 Tax=Xylanibacter ruminicola TaxID=839 RepID=A0A1H5WI91_XYLRU|nr:hypothetical protein SAMN05216354_2366 [Xylanibacter ruminicola]
MVKHLEVFKKNVSLPCVFHSIRFKVNKGLGHSGDPFFYILILHVCRFDSTFCSSFFQIRSFFQTRNHTLSSVF